MEATLELVAGAPCSCSWSLASDRGLGLGVRDVLAPLRRGRLLAAALVANFVAAPGIAWALVSILDLSAPHAFGLLLLGGAAGAPFLSKLAELARGDVAFSVGLMLLLTIGSAAFMPAVLPFLVPGLSVGAWPILRPILATMLLPLGIGMLVRAASGRWADRFRPPSPNLQHRARRSRALIGLNFRTCSHDRKRCAGRGDAVRGDDPPSGTPSAVLPLPRGRSWGSTGQRKHRGGSDVATGTRMTRSDHALVSTGLLVLVPAARYFAWRPSAVPDRDARTAGEVRQEEAAR